MELGVVLFTAATFFAGGFVLGGIRERNRITWEIEYFPEPDPTIVGEETTYPDERPTLRLVA
jgi:hypothetical protein